GLFQFMFMDCWPSVTWSVVSHGRRPKAGYTALRAAYQPVLVGALLERDVWVTYTDLSGFALPIGVVSWIVNDHAIAYPDAQVSLSLREDATGREADLATVPCTVPADGVMTLPRTELALPADWPDGDYTLRLRLTAGAALLR